MKRITLHSSLAIALLLACLLVQTPQAYALADGHADTALTLQFEETGPEQDTPAEQVPQAYALPDGHEGTAPTLQSVETDPEPGVPAEQTLQDACALNYSLPKTGDERLRQFASIGMCIAATSAAACFSVNRRRKDDSDVL